MIAHHIIILTFKIDTSFPPLCLTCLLFFAAPQDLPSLHLFTRLIDQVDRTLTTQRKRDDEEKAVNQSIIVIDSIRPSFEGGTHLPFVFWGLLETTIPSYRRNKDILK